MSNESRVWRGFVDYYKGEPRVIVPNGNTEAVITQATDYNALVAELAAAKEGCEVGRQISGSFFDALKPLNLPTINVANPGVHVTNLIRELAAAKAEVVNLTCNADIHNLECENAIRDINALRVEVERLRAELAAESNQRKRSKNRRTMGAGVGSVKKTTTT